MANQKHLEILEQGTAIWNEWRERHPRIHPDLSKADLSEADLSEADLSGADLSGADLSGADLIRADLSDTNLTGADLSGAELTGANLSEADLSEAVLSEADLSEANLSEAVLSGTTLFAAHLSEANIYKANLSEADLSEADLSEADLSQANLSRANLRRTNLSGADLSRADLSRANLSEARLSDARLFEANLSGADLSKANLNEAKLHRAILNDTNLSRTDLTQADLNKADLSRAILVGANLSKTKLKDCSIYGISAWDVQLEGAEQLNLTITPKDQPTITVDNLKIAQFIYLLLNNAEIRDVIDTIAKKAVLILGRFTPERKAVLDALRDELRRHGYLPILFDFDKPSSRNFTETVRTLAHLSRFIVADLTDPSSIPQELYAIVPTLAVPIQPLLETSKREYSMFSDLFRTYHWVLPIYRYTNIDNLLTSFQEQIIDPAEQKAQELIKQKAQELLQP